MRPLQITPKIHPKNSIDRRFQRKRETWRKTHLKIDQRLVLKSCQNRLKGK